VLRFVGNDNKVDIPEEFLYILKIDDFVEFFTDDDCIAIKKYTPKCVMCDVDTEDYRYFKGARVCMKCIEEVKSGLIKPEVPFWKKGRRHI